MSARPRRPASHIVTILVFVLGPIGLMVPDSELAQNASAATWVIPAILAAVFLIGLYGVVRVRSWSRWYCSAIILYFMISFFFVSDPTHGSSRSEEVRLAILLDCLFGWWLYSFAFGKASVFYFRSRQLCKGDEPTTLKDGDAAAERPLARSGFIAKCVSLFKKKSQEPTPLLVKIGVGVGIWYFGSEVAKQVLLAPREVDLSWSNLSDLNWRIVQVLALIAVWNLRKWGVYIMTLITALKVVSLMDSGTHTNGDPARLGGFMVLLVLVLVLVGPAFVYWKKFGEPEETPQPESTAGTSKPQGF
jgi:hypothetical protein